MTRECVIRVKEELDLAINYFSESDPNRLVAICSRSIVNNMLEMYQHVNDGSFDEVDAGKVLTMVKNALEGKIIAPIEDTEWEFKYFKAGTASVLQSRRYPALYKTYTRDTNEPIYLDFTRFRFVNMFDDEMDATNEDEYKIFAFANKIMHEHYPIKMPYLPNYDAVKTRIACFSSSSEEDEVDIIYLQIVDHEPFDRIHIALSGEYISIKRYFRAIEYTDDTWGWEEISREEYMSECLAQPFYYSFYKNIL